MPRNIHFATDTEWGERKDALGKTATWEKVVQAGIITLEKEMNKVPEEEALKEPAYFVLDKSPEALIREFDVLKDNMWVTVPFDAIPLKGVFRVREDATVIKTEGHKELIKLSQSFNKDGISYAEVIPK